MKRIISQLGTLLLALCGLTQCVMAPPIPPPGAGTGLSLDAPPRPPAGQPTRYLEPTPGPPLPDTPPSAVADASGALRYETPADIDPTLPATSQPQPSADSVPALSQPQDGNKPPVTEPANTTATDSPPTPTPPAKPSTPEQMPFGLPVPGKKGFVYSPFDKAQMVDVRGIPPGKKVRCPYTSKIFLVP